MPIDVAGQLSLSWREESTSNEKSRVCVINRDDEEISRIFFLSPFLLSFLPSRFETFDSSNNSIERTNKNV